MPRSPRVPQLWRGGGERARIWSLLDSIGDAQTPTWRVSRAAARNGRNRQGRCQERRRHPAGSIQGVIKCGSPLHDRVGVRVVCGCSMARLVEGGQSTRGGGFVASALQPRALVETLPADACGCCCCMELKWCPAPPRRAQRRGCPGGAGHMIWQRMLRRLRALLMVPRQRAASSEAAARECCGSLAWCRKGRRRVQREEGARRPLRSPLPAAGLESDKTLTRRGTEQKCRDGDP